MGSRNKLITRSSSFYSRIHRYRLWYLWTWVRLRYRELRILVRCIFRQVLSWEFYWPSVPVTAKCKINKKKIDWKISTVKTYIEGYFVLASSRVSFPRHVQTSRAQFGVVKKLHRLTKRSHYYQAMCVKLSIIFKFVKFPSLELWELVLILWILLKKTTANNTVFNFKFFSIWFILNILNN